MTNEAATVGARPRYLQRITWRKPGIMRWLLAWFVLCTVSCGGGSNGRSSAPPVSDAAPPPAAAGARGTLHEVLMLVNPDGQFVYQPATLSIRVGDRVRWVNASGGPHNVAFYRNGVPRGAEGFLNATMTGRMGDLTGALLFEPNAVYEISFDGAPTGTYEYFCTPHEMLGMKARLTVSR